MLTFPFQLDKSLILCIIVKIKYSEVILLKYYFKLRWLRINRQLIDWGFHPIVGYFVMLAIFGGCSFYLFAKNHYASWIYLFLALSLVSGLSDPKRMDFLHQNITSKLIKMIRLIENILAIVPFMVIFYFKGYIRETLLLLILSTLMALFRFKTRYSVSIPTPCSKYPYEFTAGFRKTWFVFVFALILTIISVKINNFNLGLFSVIVYSINCTLFNIAPEPYFFVWINHLDAQRFLLRKGKIALLYTSLLALPSIMLLFFFFPAKIHLILGFHILGLLLVITGVSSKYSSFPHEISVRKSLVILMTIWLPPLLLFTIPWFYFESKKNLKGILEC